MMLVKYDQKTHESKIDKVMHTLFKFYHVASVRHEKKIMQIYNL